MPKQVWHDNTLTLSENHSVILSETDAVILSLSKDLNPYPRWLKVRIRVAKLPKDLKIPSPSKGEGQDEDAKHLFPRRTP